MQWGALRGKCRIGCFWTTKGWKSRFLCLLKAFCRKCCHGFRIEMLRPKRQWNNVAICRESRQPDTISKCVHSDWQNHKSQRLGKRPGVRTGGTSVLTYSSGCFTCSSVTYLWPTTTATAAATATATASLTSRWNRGCHRIACFSLWGEFKTHKRGHGLLVSDNDDDDDDDLKWW